MSPLDQDFAITYMIIGSCLFMVITGVCGTIYRIASQLLKRETSVEKECQLFGKTLAIILLNLVIVVIAGGALILFILFCKFAWASGIVMKEALK